MEQSLRAFEEFETSYGVWVKLSDGNQVRLPLGFHFRPTESQLVIHYLLPKTQNEQLPNYYVKEISNPIATDLAQLCTGSMNEDDEYFFSKQSTSFQEKYSTTDGLWILVGNKLVLAVDGDQEVEAYRAKYLFLDCDCKFSGWKMYVYSLRPFNFISKSQAAEKSGGDNWVVIRIFHERLERQLYFKNIGGEEEWHEDWGTEQVSSNIAEDADQQSDQDSQTNTGDVTSTSSCISNGCSTKSCSSRRR